jgi:hypothetical protein
MTLISFTLPSLPCPDLTHLGTTVWGAENGLGVGSKNKGAPPVCGRPTKNSRPWNATPRITACLDLSTPGRSDRCECGLPGQGNDLGATKCVVSGGIAQ